MRGRTLRTPSPVAGHWRLRFAVTSSRFVRGTSACSSRRCGRVGCVAWWAHGAGFHRGHLRDHRVAAVAAVAGCACAVGRRLLSPRPPPAREPVGRRGRLFGERDRRAIRHIPVWQPQGLCHRGASPVRTRAQEWPGAPRALTTLRAPRASAVESVPCAIGCWKPSGRQPWPCGSCGSNAVRSGF